MKYYVLERKGWVYSLGFNSPGTIGDLPGLDVVGAGSTAYNSDTGAVYMLQSDGTWKEQ
ncbi:hypothetical protein FACS189499_03960 [Clostridia bacterium]|nr:hypothetical protein FACS189499_03960 [Clostridia bacterium]